MITKEVKRFADKKGYKNIRFVARYNGKDIYTPVYPKDIHIGLPRYIVVDGSKLELIDGLDGLRLFEKLCGKEKSVLDD